MGELAGISPHVYAKDSHSNLVICMYYITYCHVNVGVCYGPTRTNTVPACRKKFFGMALSSKVEIFSKCTRWISALPPHMPRPYWLPDSNPHAPSLAPYWPEPETDMFQLNTMAWETYLRWMFDEGGKAEHLINLDEYLHMQVTMFVEWMALVGATLMRDSLVRGAKKPHPKLHRPNPPFGDTDVSQLNWP